MELDCVCQSWISLYEPTRISREWSSKNAQEKAFEKFVEWRTFPELFTSQTFTQSSEEETRRLPSMFQSRQLICFWCAFGRLWVLWEVDPRLNERKKTIGGIILRERREKKKEREGGRRGRVLDCHRHQKIWFGFPRQPLQAFSLGEICNIWEKARSFGFKKAEKKRWWWRLFMGVKAGKKTKQIHERYFFLADWFHFGEIPNDQSSFRINRANYIAFFLKNVYGYNSSQVSSKKLFGQIFRRSTKVNRSKKINRDRKEMRWRNGTNGKGINVRKKEQKGTWKGADGLLQSQVRTNLSNEPPTRIFWEEKRTSETICEGPSKTFATFRLATSQSKIWEEKISEREQRIPQ